MSNFLAWLAAADASPAGLSFEMLQDKELVFPQGRVNVSEPVRLVLEKTGENIFTAGQLWLCHLLKNADPGKYLRTCQEKKIKPVSLLHRAEIKNIIQSGSAASLAQQQQQPDAQLSSERPAKRLETAGGAPQAALPGHDAVSAPSSAALQGKKSALSDALKQELVYYTRTSCLHTPRSLVQVLQIDKKSQEVESERAKGKKEKRSVKRPSAPIIIVPAASSNSALNLHNIKQFLEEGIYVTPAQAMEQCPDKPNSVMVVHKHPLWGSVAYKVLDKVPIVDEAALERIVGVVVSGMGWQLKEFPFWNNDPAIIFSKCRGVYVYFDDQKKSDQVKAWNVADFPIKRQSRNKDPVQAHGVWQSICDHMQINHPKLVQALLQAHEARTLAEKSARLKATQSLLDEAEQVAGEDSDEEEDDELVGDREG